MGLSPGTRVGPYEILNPIGAGGMGEVHRARDTKLGRCTGRQTLEILANDLRMETVINWFDDLRRRVPAAK